MRKKPRANGSGILGRGWGEAKRSEIKADAKLKTVDQNYFQAHGWPLAVALIAAGIVSWVWGSYLHKQGSRTVIDKATGQEMTLGGDDALFFIGMRYWGPILAAVAVAILAYRGF